MILKYRDACIKREVLFIAIITEIKITIGIPFRLSRDGSDRINRILYSDKRIMCQLLKRGMCSQGWTMKREEGRRETFILCSFKKGLPREAAVYQRQARCG